MTCVEKVLTHLSDQGHRVTGPRRAILERIAQYNQPFSAEQLFKDVGGERGPIGRATVYRTVDLLHDDHWLARVHWSASRAFATHDIMPRVDFRHSSIRRYPIAHPDLSALADNRSRLARSLSGVHSQRRSSGSPVVSPARDHLV